MQRFGLYYPTEPHDQRLETGRGRSKSGQLSSVESPRRVIDPQVTYGGEAGIRTLGTGLSPYNGLANRRFRPLSHLTADGKYTARKYLLNRVFPGGAYNGFSNRRLPQFHWKIG